MTILRFLFYAFLFYLAFKLVFDLIIPIYRTTRQVKKGIREMKDRMGQTPGPFQEQPRPQVRQESNNNNKGDYIEFEEIK
jgi:hypothetical protein